MSEPVAWASLMRLGLGQMGLTPDQFWALTPAEFLLMAGIGPQNAQRMTRGALAALEARVAAKHAGKEWVND
ncbi:MAG: phage tail assembly chaperone [Pseudomonadota bacterium]